MNKNTSYKKEKLLDGESVEINSDEMTQVLANIWGKLEKFKKWSKGYHNLKYSAFDVKIRQKGNIFWNFFENSKFYFYWF